MPHASFKTYYSLTKPGIIYGNALTAAGGFLLAAKGQVNVGLLVATLIGTSLIIGAGCVVNNFLDREIDGKMARTKKRASVQGLISPQNGLLFAAALVGAGFALLGAYTNWLVVGLGVVGFVDYVLFYSLAKRRSPHGTLVGTISGATPILAGYCAVTNRLDLGALLLFLVLVFWQMGHFYAIAVYRLKDYQAAGVPVWPAQKGIDSTKKYMFFYIVAFMVAVALLAVFHYTGLVFLLAMTVVGGVWLWRCLQGFTTPDSHVWARQTFLFSLVVILSLSLLLSIDTFLP